jgi:uncharacterized repeat protein (TIGR02543 family)
VKSTVRRLILFLMIAALASLTMPAVAFAGGPSWYSVSFYQNDSPTDQTVSGQMSNTPTTLTLFDDMDPSFANPGYSFSDWSTTPTNSVGSNVLSNGAPYSFTSALNLFAQWTPDVYIVSYIPAGGVVSSSSVNFTVGSSPLALLTPTQPGYIFDGWNTAADGSGVSYAAGSAYTPATNISLYAQWSVVPSGITTFISNGASGTISPMVGDIGTSITLPSGTSLSDPGSLFAGWNTSASGNGTNYVAGSSFVITSSITLYAQWSLTPTFTINFSSNGGVGTVASLSGTSGSSFQLPGGTGLSFVGHTFSSWNSKSDGSGTAFNVDAPLQLNASMTLYAQWDVLLTSKPSNVLIGAVGSFATNSATLTSNLKTQILRLAVLTKTGHFKAETLYGYTNNSGSVASQVAISSRRANVVAAYLRAELRSMHVTGVTVTSAGEGTVTSGSGTTGRRVEVFVKG